MKPFWQRPPKKNKKKKRKPQAVQSEQLRQIPKKSTPMPWTPLYSTKPKTPVAEDKLLSKAPVTYQIPPIPYHVVQAPKTVSSEPKSIHHREQQVRKEFLKTFRRLTDRWRSWDIWTDFITLVACTISNSVDKLHYDEREKTYLEIIKKYSKLEQALFPELYAYLVLALEENPEQDFLGDIYTELGLNSEEHKQYFTPYSICHLMAEVTYGNLASEVEEKGVVEVHDCCCGAGATLIAAANVAKYKLGEAKLNFQNHLLVTGQDIDYLVTMMSYIQLSLLGIAGYFKVGDALTNPMTDKDSLDGYWFTPMYFFPVWQYRRIWHKMDELIGGKPDAEVHKD